MYFGKMKFFFILVLLISALHVAVGENVASLIKITDLKLVLNEWHTQIFDVSLTSCAFNCRKSQTKCCSFYYNKKTRLCTLGFWIIPSTTPRNEMTELYSLEQNWDTKYTPNDLTCSSNVGISLSVQSPSNPRIVGSFCNTTDNFFIMTHGSTTVCAWIADQICDYATASATCLEKGAVLYTFKTTEKANLLKAMSELTVSQHMWIGLNDILQEGVYRWIDDNTTVTSLLIPYTDVWDLSEDEDCFFMFPPYTGVDDLGCVNGKSFICEKNPQC